MLESNRFMNFRFVAALSAAIGLGAWTITAPNVRAATVQVGATSCVYSSFSGDTAGNFVFNCSGTPQAGVLVLGLTGTLSSLAPGATTTLTVTRSGQTAGGGSATGNLAVSGTGGCTLSANAVTFADGSATPNPATVTVTAGPTIGTSCTINLTAVTASLGSPASTMISIANAPAPNPGIIAFNLANTLSTLAPGGTTTLSVVRTGMTAGGGAASGHMAAFGGCTISANTVTFADGVGTGNPATITVTAPPTLPLGTICSVNLGAVGAPLGSPSTTAISIANAPAPNPGIIAFNLANTLSNLAPGGTTTLSVVRTGMTAGGGTARGHLAAFGGCTISADTVTFADGVGTGNPATITVTAPSTLPSGTTCTVNLGAVGASLGSPSTTSIIISASGGGAACTTTADLPVAWTGGQTFVGPGPGKTAAVSVTPPAAVAAGTQLGNFVLSETSSTGDLADVQFSVSNCPADFAKTAPCAQHTQYSGGTLKFSIGPKPADTPWYLQVCELPAGTTTVYLNLRQIKRPTPVPPEGPGVASCQFATCPVFVQFN